MDKASLTEVKQSGPTLDSFAAMIELPRVIIPLAMLCTPPPSDGARLWATVLLVILSRAPQLKMPPPSDPAWLSITTALTRLSSLRVYIPPPPNLDELPLMEVFARATTPPWLLCSPPPLPRMAELPVTVLSLTVMVASLNMPPPCRATLPVTRVRDTTRVPPMRLNMPPPWISASLPFTTRSSRVRSPWL